MNTQDLPEEVKALKSDLVKLIEAFNNKTGLAINGVIIEPRTIKDIAGKKVAIDYSVGVNIEL